MIPKIDRLILKELIGPWVFGVAIFTVLIMAGTFLFEITKYLSQGIDLVTSTYLILLLIPGVAAKTFSMAVLLATLLSFGRLSGDSEIVALKAAGVSIGRIMVPVAGFGLTISLIALSFGEYVVPEATLRAVELRIEISKTLDSRSDQPTFRAIYREDGTLEAMLSARDFDMGNRRLRDAYLITFSESEQPLYLLEAGALQFTDRDDWAIEEGGRLISFDGGPTITLTDGAFPDGIRNPNVTDLDLIAQTLSDLDALGMTDMRTQIERERANPASDPKQVANLEFGYWNKIAIPFAAFVFGLVGAPLGIRSHRTGAASGFWLSVIIIFAYMLLANMMSIYAQGGAISPAVASFAPLVIGLVVAIVLITKRN